MSSYFECSGNGPIVTTKAGKIRGYLWNTTYTFQGIKYANAKRFQMPEEIQPWDGIKDATSYGYVCPLLTQDVPNGEIMVPHTRTNRRVIRTIIRISVAVGKKFSGTGILPGLFYFCTGHNTV